jgi:hypothetical protein
MLIVVMIMAVVVGVTSSLVGGFISMFEMTEDQTVSKRRSQDVFNILKIPVQNAGLGLPAAIPNTLNKYYFSANSESGTPGTDAVIDWPAPVEVVTGPNGSQALRVLYSLSSGSKNGPEEILDFSKIPDENDLLIEKEEYMTITASLSDDLSNHLGVSPGADDVRAYITFPNINMHPIFVEELVEDGKKLKVRGRPPFEDKEDRSKDVFGRNEIRPYHDLYVVRAGVAYVDDASNFVFLDVPNMSHDPSSSSTYPPVSDDSYSGFRVEGIRGVSFDLDHELRYLTMHVLAEGDIADSTRKTNATKPAEVRARWTPLIGPLNDELSYEEYSMTWRMRNIKLKNVP